MCPGRYRELYDPDVEITQRFMWKPFLVQREKKVSYPSKTFYITCELRNRGGSEGSTHIAALHFDEPPLFIAREELLTETKTCPPHHTTPVGHRQQERERATRQTDPKN